MKRHGSNNNRFFGTEGAKKEHFQRLEKPCSVEKDGVYKEFESRDRARGYICRELDDKVSISAIGAAIKHDRPYKGYVIKNVDKIKT